MRITREYNRPIIEMHGEQLHGSTRHTPPGCRVPDARRTDFFREELAEVGARHCQGHHVRAFHAWSLLEDFEWTDGYSREYGLTFMDFRDQKRTVKDSGRWYARVTAANRLNV